VLAFAGYGILRKAIMPEYRKKAIALTMDGFYYSENDKPVTAKVVRMQRFITGKAKLQSKALGIVELDDGTVRTFLERYDHNPNINGRLNTVGEPLRYINFEKAVADIAELESPWITERLPEFSSGVAGQG
jgi:hypothetical protein